MLKHHLISYFTTLAVLCIAATSCNSRTATDAPQFATVAYAPEAASGFRILSSDPTNTRSAQPSVTNTSSAQPSVTNTSSAKTSETNIGSASTVIEIFNPWQGATDEVRRVMVRRGDDAVPQGFDGTVIDGEARRIVAMSSTYVAMLDILGVADRIVGVSGIDFISTPSVAERADEIIDVGNEADVDFERLIAARPDLVLVYGVGAVSAMEPKLRELGVPFVYIGDYLESSPLGKAEWIVALGEMTGRRSEAREIYTSIRDRYNAIAREAQSTTARPKVMMNIPYGDTWYLPSGDSYMARLIADAGGDYLYSHTTGNKSYVVDIETAYTLANSADVWLNPGQANSMADFAASVPRFTGVKAVTDGRVYNNNARLTRGGGNDFYESGIVHPDLILADLVAILNASAPADTLYYYKQLK